MEELDSAILGGGCFWCLEAVYIRLEGVKSVISGYSGGNVENPTYEQVCTGETSHAEVVKINYDLNKTTSINPSNKSYITIGDDGYISGLVEKKVISSTFGCGSYSFENSEDYCEYFEKLSTNTKNLFLSDIIKDMVDDGWTINEGTDI